MRSRTTKRQALAPLAVAGAAVVGLCMPRLHAGLADLEPAAEVSQTDSVQAPTDGSAAAPAVVDAPVGADVDGQALNVVVKAVQGLVRVRESEEEPWRPAEVDMELDVGAEFQTGPRSAVQFLIRPNQWVVLERLGTVKVLEVIRDADRVKTELGMPYGRIRYEIEEAGLEHDSNIRSPSAVIAVRGTELTFQHDALDVFCMGQGSGLRFIDRVGSRRQAIRFGSGNVRSKMKTGQRGAGQVERQEASLDSRGKFVGRLPLEQQRQEEEPAIGGEDYRTLVSAKQISRRDMISSVVVPKVRGPLIFNLVWKNETKGIANLNFYSILPNRQMLSAANPMVGSSPKQGMHSGDNLGLAGGGVEQIEFPLFFPTGKHHLKVQHQGSPRDDTAQVFLTGTQGPLGAVILNKGSRSPIFLSPGEGFKVTVNVGNTPGLVKMSVKKLREVSNLPGTAASN